MAWGRYACKDNQNFYRALLQRPDVQDTLHSNEAVVINAWEKYSGDGPAQGIGAVHTRR